MATGGTSSDPWTNLMPAHAARLLEHVRTWQRRLRDAVDRHYDPRAYDVARELHDVVRVFGDVGLRAPVEAFDGPRPRRGPLGMNVLHAPHSKQDPIATCDPDIAVSALTSWSTWLEERAAATPASGEAAAKHERPGDDPRLEEYRPASDFACATHKTMHVSDETLRRWERDGLVRTKDNGKKKSARRVTYLLRDIVEQRRPSTAELEAWFASLAT
jgi:hypothetical protein